MYIFIYLFISSTATFTFYRVFTFFTFPFSFLNRTIGHYSVCLSGCRSVCLYHHVVFCNFLFKNEQQQHLNGYSSTEEQQHCNGVASKQATIFASNADYYYDQQQQQQAVKTATVIGKWCGPFH
ncbi:hypothetical protein D917_03904, partial [Trichinella nativa]